MAVQVNVTNTSQVDGEEVVQLYVRDLVSSVTTPIKALKGFERVHIPAGETKTVYFAIKPKDLSLWNRAMEQVVEAGVFRVQVGGSSTEGLSAEFEIKKEKKFSKK